jgi:hypothetical protein
MPALLNKYELAARIMCGAAKQGRDLTLSVLKAEGI